MSHAHYWADHGGGEAALLGLRSEGSVALQYSGRVVLELFQNALDCAASRVVVRLEGETLVVGNDGARVSVDPEFDYRRQNLRDKRSNFNALCSLHSSNKSADEQFGNKGIGFRSVFGVSDRVAVWSRLEGGAWWGFELRRPLNTGRWEPTGFAEYDAVVLASTLEDRPSFHFPRPCFADQPPVAGPGLETLILVPVRPDALDQIRGEIETLASSRLHFVALRKRGVSVRAGETEVAAESGWSTRTEQCPDLADAARKAEHEVSVPSVAIAVPPPGGAPAEGWIYNYLPTRMPTGLPVDVHGDFQVKADRESMGLAKDKVGDYNRALLDRAAALHVGMLHELAAQPRVRDDFWALATCPVGAPQPWVDGIWNRIFASWTPWVNFAKACFGETERPESTWREFWDATEAWLVSRGRGLFSKWATSLCEELARAGIPLIPVRVTAGPRAVPLPLAGSGTRHLRRVFYTNKGEGLVLPQALARIDRAITTFDLGKFAVPSLVGSFRPEDVLPDLRQVPANPAQFTWTPTMSPEEQREVLAFAKGLLSEGREAHFAWRAYAEDTRRRMGRAISTLFLPLHDGTWAPARQLRVQDVDTDRWIEGGILLDDAFLARLGVAPSGGVPLVEEGDAGIIEPLLAPPPLQPAGDDNRLRPLRPLSAFESDFDAVCLTVSGLPDDNDQATVLASFARAACVPADRMRLHSHLAPLPDRIAPGLVLLNRQDGRRGRFLPVPTGHDDDDALRRLGALDRLDALKERGPQAIAACVRHIADRFSAPSTLPGDLARGLTEVHEALVWLLPGAVVPYDAPVLVESAAGLRWERPGADYALATAEDRAALRRAFPTLGLVAATGSGVLALTLGARHVRLHVTVRPDSGDALSPTAAELYARLGQLLDALCARYEVSRLNPAIDEVRVRYAWATRPLRQVPDAYLELVAANTNLPMRESRKHEFGDAFFVAVTDQAGHIIFDVDRDRPRLRHFADALAQLLFNNRGAGPLLGEVLAAADDDAGDETRNDGRDAVTDLLDRYEAGEARRQWRQRLAPISPETSVRLLEILKPHCADPETVLRSGRVRRIDVIPNGPTATATILAFEVTTHFRTANAESFTPVVVVRAENEDLHRGALSSRAAQLRALTASHRDGETLTDAAFQRAFAEPVTIDRLDFDPVAAIAESLTTLGITLGAPLDEVLARYAVRFLPVTQRPVFAAEVGWTAAIVAPLEAGAGPEKKIDPKDIIDIDATKALFGAEAEAAFVKGVVAWTTPLLSRPGAREALLEAIEGAKTRETVRQALAAGDVTRALHVAELWSGLGFDVLGLCEDEAGAVVVERYECKGLPTGKGKIRMHLSRREWAVAERVRNDGGVWRLVGVEQDGRAVDLTRLLAPILEQGTALGHLARSGIEADSWRVTVDREG